VQGAPWVFQSVGHGRVGLVKRCVRLNVEQFDEAIDLDDQRAGDLVTLGVRLKRPLLWGLLYILVWEGFIARLGKSASRLAIASYTRSILSSIAGYDLRFADLPAAACVIVPLAVTAVALGYAAHRLTVQDVA